jgi:peptide-methionine (R)-S-oxide reductase
MTRREWIGMGSVGAVAIAIAGKFALTAATTDRTTADTPADSFPVRHTDAQWRALLSPAAYRVLRQNGTERAYSSALLEEHHPGIFACAGCDQKAFSSRTKFDSHTGWPSFWDVLPGAVVRRTDRSLGVSRTEVRCTRCGGHLGHVFEDGPEPTGLRYCMNGVAMAFRPGKA